MALDYLAFNTTRLPFFRRTARYAFASEWSPSLVKHDMGLAAFPDSGIPTAGLGIRTAAPYFTRPGPSYLKTRYPNPKKFPHILLVVLRDARLEALAKDLARTWIATLHVRVKVQPLNPSSYGLVLNARAFDVAIVRWGGVYPDPQDFMSSQLGPGTGNVTGWSDAQFDGKVSLADSYSLSDPRRAALYGDAAAIAAHKLPLLPLDAPAIPALIRPDLRGVSVAGLGTLTGDWRRAGFTTR
jgi:oligopeptide transport system substrate-binding protein